MTTEIHVHAWVLPVPDGSVAVATCACSATKRLLNAWKDDYSEEELSRLGMKAKEKKVPVTFVYGAKKPDHVE